jgi:oligopeptide/dipeptide ABC transporter ATP-binding protein
MRPILMPDPAMRQTVQPVLEVRELRVHFDESGGTVRAVDGVSFQVMPGRTLGIVGESGCGKSVTARAILRIVDRGSRVVAGSVLLRRKHQVQDLMQLEPGSRQMRQIRGREIALVFQEPMTSFSPVHTIGNQIVEAVRLHSDSSRSEAKRKAIRQLEQVGTPHPAHIMEQYAWELSGGLRQRAMLAMALVGGPSVLIADEPTTALDVTTQAQVLELLRQLQQQNGMAVVLITHDLGVVAQIADDVVIMYLGSVVEQGPADAIFHDPKHPYTRALLSSRPTIMGQPRTRLATLPGTVPHPLNRPTGCPFHPRCASGIAGRCDRQVPRQVSFEPSHMVQCHLYHEADVQ